MKDLRAKPEYGGGIHYVIRFANGESIEVLADDFIDALREGAREAVRLCTSCADLYERSGNLPGVFRGISSKEL